MPECGRGDLGCTLAYGRSTGLPNSCILVSAELQSLFGWPEVEAGGVKALLVVILDIVHQDIIANDHAACPAIHGAEESLRDALIVLHFEMDHHCCLGFGLFEGIGRACCWTPLLGALSCKVSRLATSQTYFILQY